MQTATLAKVGNYFPMLIIAFFFLISSNNLLAQSSVISSIAIGQLPVEQSGTTSTYNYIAIIDLTDTLDISTITLKMDTTEGGNALYEHTFIFDATTNLPANNTFSRRGNRVFIGIGSFIDYPLIYIESKLQYTTGSYSAITRYNTL